MESVSFDNSGLLFIDGKLQKGINVLDLLRIAFQDQKDIANKTDYLNLLQRLQLMDHVCNKTLLRHKVEQDMQTSTYPYYFLEVFNG